jgi:hypothetical protein
VLEGEAIGLGRQLFAQKPAAIAEQFEQYWRAWHAESVVDAAAR